MTTHTLLTFLLLSVFAVCVLYSVISMCRNAMKNVDKAFIDMVIALMWGFCFILVASSYTFDQATIVDVVIVAIFSCVALRFGATRID